MSVNIRPHPRGGWDVDINVLLATGDRHRERRKLNAGYSKTTAKRMGRAPRARAAALRSEDPEGGAHTGSVCAAIRRGLRAREPSEAERHCGQGRDPADPSDPRIRVSR